MKKKYLIAITIFLFIYLLIDTNIVFAKQPQITAEKAILIEAETGKILYQKNAYEKAYPASTTKILTAILTLENCNKDEIVVANDDVLNIGSGSSKIYLSPGEKMSVEQLLYGLMLASGNDAAIALADHISGSVEEFVTLMNNKAQLIGANNTHFTNPHGFHDENHYTTAYDLAMIARYAIKNQEFNKIIQTHKYILSPTNKFDQERIWINTNRFINPNSEYYYPKSTGIKTGYTSTAKNCLVASAHYNGMDLIAVALKCEKDMYVQVKNLLEYGFENYNKLNIVEKNKIIKTVEVKDGENETVDLITQDSITGVFAKNDIDSMYNTINIKEDITAPVAKGDILGDITYHIGNDDIKVNLIAANNVEKKSLLNILKPKKELSIQAWIIILLFIAYIALRIQISINKRKRKHKTWRY